MPAVAPVERCPLVEELAPGSEVGELLLLVLLLLCVRVGVEVVVAGKSDALCMAW